MPPRTLIAWMPWNYGNDAPQNGEPILAFIPEIGPKKVKYQHGVWFDGYHDWQPTQIMAWAWYNDPDPILYTQPTTTAIEPEPFPEPSTED